MRREEANSWLVSPCVGHSTSSDVLWRGALLSKEQAHWPFCTAALLHRPSCTPPALAILHWLSCTLALLHWLSCTGFPALLHWPSSTDHTGYPALQHRPSCTPALTILHSCTHNMSIVRFSSTRFFSGWIAGAAIREYCDLGQLVTC